MSNPISEELTLGAIGELLVQMRFLQYDVQAAPPLKDSGNDLIAIRGRVFRSIQVKATEGDVYSLPQIRSHYDILAAVHIVVKGQHVLLDESEVFLIEKEALADFPRAFSKIGALRIDTKRIETLFSPKAINKGPNYPSRDEMVSRAFSRDSSGTGTPTAIGARERSQPLAKRRPKGSGFNV